MPEDPRPTFDTQDPDFRSALDALLGAYRPVLEEELKRSQNAADLAKDAASNRNCDEEIKLGERIFSAFFTEKVASAMIGPEGRSIAGPIEKWRWCFLHIRCCMIFGWLLCRGPRNFRAAAYYLYRYWLCVRQVIGRPVSQPLADDQRQDLQILVRALADAYKPYLAEQLAEVEFPIDLPDQIVRGRVDCFEGENDLGAVFSRLLSVEVAPALFGREAFAEQANNPFLRFCRCWCLCAMQFGCCLARARSFVGVIRCLIAYFACVRRCFRPLVAEIDTPAADQCVETSVVPACSNLIAITITGAAAGSAFTNYTLRYRWGLGSLIDDAVVYPNCGRPPGQTSSTIPVSGGVLGYLDRNMLPPGVTDFEVTLDVFGSGALHLTVSRAFKIKTTDVEITQVAHVDALVAPDPFHPADPPVKLIKATNNVSTSVPEVSVGGSITVTGSANIIGCDRIMSQFMLCLNNAPPATPVPLLSDCGGGTPLRPAVVYADNPSHPWQSGCLFPTSNVITLGDLVAEWGTQNCIFPPGSVPKVRSKEWNSTAFNGRFVILLEVRDRLVAGGAFPGTVAAYDQVAVWIDNREPTGSIVSIGGVSGCGDLHLKDYKNTTADIIGTAYDPPIDASAPQQAPNDNFGGYSLGFQKNGSGSGSIPALTPGLRVPNVWPGPPVGTGTLAKWDIVSALDGGPGPVPPGSEKIARGERCAYVITLDVSDTTHVGDSGTNHSTGLLLYAINVINDL